MRLILRGAGISLAAAQLLAPGCAYQSLNQAARLGRNQNPEVHGEQERVLVRLVD